MRQTGLVKSAVAALAALIFLTGAATDPYFRVAEGDTLKKVVALLGNPATPDKDLTEAESGTIRNTLAKLDSKGARNFVIWKRERGLFYVIGFGKQGAVTVKHRFFMLK